MYRVETTELAAEQVDQLPADALAPYAEVRVVLETAPWGGRAYHRRDSEMAMRFLPFGTDGLVVYLIRDAERMVLVIRVIWIG